MYEVMIWCDQKKNKCCHRIGSFTEFNNDPENGEIKGLGRNVATVRKGLWNELSERGWTKSGNSHICPSCKD